ncbi:hypothetical protein [Erysipelothrix rhusiopathiae]|uniref:hypothetical protein n=1 Tax=Erysipelothrix rhusiopathiae TaxID=1648 RepID=UPI000E00AC57|nr:hypothetical protein [Erysipelothrix rhusiopathiae]STD63423.1 Uncharacterised protein [Erysipelothrix rhusiopathiae]
MNIIVYMVLTALFFTLGYNISRFVKDTVAWKQKRNNKVYKVFRPEDAHDALMNGIYVSAATLVAYTSFGLFEATVISVIAFLAVLWYSNRSTAFELFQMRWSFVSLSLV